MNKIMKSTAVMLVTLNMLSVSVLAKSPVMTGTGGIPTIYNLSKTQQKSTGKSLTDYINKSNPTKDDSIHGKTREVLGATTYTLNKVANSFVGLVSGIGGSLGISKPTPTEIIVDRVDGDGKPLVITKVTNRPTSFAQFNEAEKSGNVQDKYYETVILENKFSPTKPPTVQQTLAASTMSEKTLGTQLAKTDPIMKDYLDSKGLSYKLSTDKMVINAVNTMKTEQVEEANVRMAKEEINSDQRDMEATMLSNYNANLALIKPVVMPNMPTTAAGLTKVDKYKTMTPTVKGYSFKLETPTLNKDAMLKEFTSGLNLEGNELMRKAVENFQGLPQK